MRRKLVLWGSNEKNEKLLVALELLEQDNIVNIYTFSENVATEALYKDLHDKWRDDIEINFPTDFTKIERKLSVSSSILPMEIKVDKPETITRVQAEWHFVVLSSKLYGMYKSEYEEIKEKIDHLTAFDSQAWDELRTFWAKIQEQVNERNLFREHGAALREKTNVLFDRLKELKKSYISEAESISKKHLDDMIGLLQNVEAKIEKGLGLGPLFNELKKIQNDIKDIKFTKEDRNEIWDKINVAFKKLKEKRGQEVREQKPSNHSVHLHARFDGLLGAIQKMQKSIDFDQKDLDFQTKKVAETDGQLESQLRQAKIKMIEERVNSKKDKLNELLKIKADLSVKIEKEKQKALKFEKQEKIDIAKESVKQKIASEIHENKEELDKISDKLEKAAKEIGTKKQKNVPIVEKLSDSLEQLMEDVVDTVKAVADVAEDKVEIMLDKAEDMFDKAEDALEDWLEKGKKSDNDKKEEE